jgi:beta-glucosidase/6-phospho-beta-glucosidase/beta-galactosidase
MIVGGRRFADLAFENFGSRVKTWITFNEPSIVCDLGYLYGRHAPGLVGVACVAGCCTLSSACPCRPVSQIVMQVPVHRYHSSYGGATSPV